jgi:hypothetical protein
LRFEGWYDRAGAYFDKLNPEQRRVVEHEANDELTPLLVIAGAGSGKTNMLAHRVAHLIVRGVDPCRVLLLTFSRRAAAEMTRRAERILSEAMRHNAGVMADALTWAGLPCGRPPGCCGSVPTRLSNGFQECDPSRRGVMSR